MGPLTEIQARVLAALPDAVAELDLGVPSRGNRFLALGLEGHDVIIEHRPPLAIGITAVPEDVGFTEPHEVYDDLDVAAARVIALLRFRRWTLPGRSMFAGECRL